MKRVQIEQPDSVDEEKAKASQICQQLANHAKMIDNNLQNAVKYLKEALIYCENDTNVRKCVLFDTSWKLSRAVCTTT